MTNPSRYRRLGVHCQRQLCLVDSLLLQRHMVQPSRADHPNLPDCLHLPIRSETSRTLAQEPAPAVYIPQRPASAPTVVEHGLRVQQLDSVQVLVDVQHSQSAARDIRRPFGQHAKFRFHSRMCCLIQLIFLSFVRCICPSLPYKARSLLSTRRMPLSFVLTRAGDESKRAHLLVIDFKQRIDEWTDWARQAMISIAILILIDRDTT